jgi:hypothetical protein
MNERKLKGGVILGHFDFIRHQWGDDGVQECNEATGVDPRHLEAEKLYSTEINERVLKWLSTTKGIGYVRKAGNHTIRNLGSLSYLVRFVNIKHFLRKAKENYEDTFQFGDVSVLMDPHSKHASVIMKDCNTVEESCAAWLGAFEGMMEITHTKGKVKQNKYQHKGDEYDEFILDWV